METATGWIVARRPPTLGDRTCRGEFRQPKVHRFAVFFFIAFRVCIMSENFLLQLSRLRTNLRQDASCPILIRVQHESLKARHRVDLQPRALRLSIAQEQVDEMSEDLFSSFSPLLLFPFLCLRFVNPFFRAGTNVDCENLSNTLRNLHFDVSIYKDFKQNEIMHEVEGGEC